MGTVIKKTATKPLPPRGKDHRPQRRTPCRVNPHRHKNTPRGTILALGNHTRRSTIVHASTVSLSRLVLQSGSWVKNELKLEIGQVADQQQPRSLAHAAKTDGLSTCLSSGR